METALLTVRLALFGVFAVAGIGKLLDLAGSEKAVRSFGIPEFLSKPVGLLLPVAELVFAVCLLFVGSSWIGAVGAMLLLVAFIIGMFLQMVKGNAPDCHCFGQIHNEPVGKKSLIRNFVIALLPVALLVSGPENQGHALGETNGQLASNVAVSLLFVFIFVTASYLHRLSSENRKLARRIGLVEMMNSGGEPLERDDMGNPTDAMPIGAPFPDFSLPDTNGRIVTFDHLLADYKPKVFLFVGPGCEPCKSLLPDLSRWRSRFGDRLRMVFVSSGTAQENRARFGDELADGMLLQSNKQLSNLVHCKWTPTALLVSADGNIISHPSVGEGAIRDLFDKLEKENINAEHFHVPSPGVPGRIKIGQPVPQIALTDLRGRTVTREDFAGERTLAVFLSTTCSYCQALVDEIREWERSETNGTRIIVFSEGERSVHEGYNIESPILIEKGYATAMKLGMFGVPSGVLVDERGVIVSETAVGGPAIWALIGKYD